MREFSDYAKAYKYFKSCTTNAILRKGTKTWWVFPEAWMAIGHKTRKVK